MGANHVRVLSEMDGVRLVAVADADPARLERISTSRNVPGFASAEQLLSETNPDMVSVVVPTSLHEVVAIAVINSGANLLVEKPLGSTLHSAARIAAAAQAAGVTLTVGHIERFNPAIRELRRRLDDGQGGRVLQVKARRVGPFPHRIRDVGVIHDLAPHDIDIMRYLLGDEVDRVYAESRRHINTDNEDLFAGMLHFSNGAIGILEINWLTPAKVRELTVLCERGMFVVDYLAQSLTFYENYAATARDAMPQSVTEGPMTRYPLANAEPLRVELEAFRDAIRDHLPAPVSAHDGMAAIAVAEALVRSADEHQPIPVAPVPA